MTISELRSTLRNQHKNKSQWRLVEASMNDDALGDAYDAGAVEYGWPPEDWLKFIDPAYRKQYAEQERQRCGLARRG